jgi:hypothetical protein
VYGDSVKQDNVDGMPIDRHTLFYGDSRRKDSIDCMPNDGSCVCVFGKCAWGDSVMPPHAHMGTKIGVCRL